MPSYHLTHRYCPHCSWTEPTDAMDEAMAAAAQLGAALARMDNALDKLRDAGCDVAPITDWGHDCVCAEINTRHCPVHGQGHDSTDSLALPVPGRYLRCRSPRSPALLSPRYGKEAE